MSTRVVVNGRLLYVGGGPTGGMSAGALERAVDDEGKPLPPEPIVVRDEGPAAGHPWDDPDGITYRVVSRLAADGGWVSAATVMRWYTVDFDVVVRWCAMGLLDAAMEAGSPSKRYRVRDPWKLKVAADDEARRRVLARSTPKRGRRSKT